MPGNDFNSFQQPRAKSRRWYQNCFVLGLIIFVAVFVILYIIALIAGLGQPASNLEANPASLGSGQASSLTNPTILPDPSVTTSQYAVRFKGNPEAKVVIEEYSDFQCPFCQQAAPIISSVLKKYGQDIYFVYKDFPLIQIHPNALNAAMAGRCAFEQAQFWELHDVMFADQSKLSAVDLKRSAFKLGLNSLQFNECLDSNKYFDAVNAEFEEGLSRNVKATPTFFINGQKFEGVPTEKQLTQIVESLL